MKFMKRSNLKILTRIHIAMQAHFALGIYGEITRLADPFALLRVTLLYNVSRFFIYQLRWKLFALFKAESNATSSEETERTETIRSLHPLASSSRAVSFRRYL